MKKTLTIKDIRFRKAHLAVLVLVPQAADRGHQQQVSLGRYLWAGISGQVRSSKCDVTFLEPHRTGRGAGMGPYTNNIHEGYMYTHKYKKTGQETGLLCLF